MRFTGRVPAAGTVLLAESPSSRWALEVGGTRAPTAATAFGVANAFDVETPGQRRPPLPARPLLRYGPWSSQLALWVGLVRFLGRRLAAGAADRRHGLEP